MLEGLRSSTEEEPGKGRAQQGSASATGYVDVVGRAVQQRAAEPNQWQRHFLNSVIKKNWTFMSGRVQLLHKMHALLYEHTHAARDSQTSPPKGI